MNVTWNSTSWLLNQALDNRWVLVGIVQGVSHPDLYRIGIQDTSTSARYSAVFDAGKRIFLDDLPITIDATQILNTIRTLVNK